MRGRLLGFVAAIAALTAVCAKLLASSVQPGVPSYAALPVLATILAAAEYFHVRFRYRGEINGLNFVESALAPLLFAFPPLVVLATVAGAQLVGDAFRRNQPVKAAFNASQWSLAACAGMAVTHSLAPRGVSAGTVVAIVAGLVAVALVNQSLFTVVLAVANDQSVSRVLRGLSGAIIPGWIAGWLLNSVIGLLFVLAYAAHPIAVVLFPAPLFALHLAYRGYAGARSDRVRLAGLHSAAGVLAEPLDPYDAIGPFLRHVARSFEASASELVLREPLGTRSHRVTVSSPSEEPYTQVLDETQPSLQATLLAAARVVRVTSKERGPLGESLAAEGWRDCLAAPLVEGSRVLGMLIVYDQIGLEGFEAGEIAVVEALARETAGALTKGRLLTAVLDERRRIAKILSSTSDGIFALGSDGAVLSWNPAMERITGCGAHVACGRRDIFRTLQARSSKDGKPVALDVWADGSDLPAGFRITREDGAERTLSCSYSRARDGAAEETLVVVARDVTPEEEIRQLRHDFGRLAEAEAAQRAIVEQLQTAFVPAAPDVDAVQLGVWYEASDPAAPTGGDLYDWQMLPSGQLHIVIVDVLGHGVAATKDALTVVHTLRTLALDDCPLSEIVARCDDLVTAQDPKLVATLLVCRYDPFTGRAAIAGGGHPPPLHISASGVRQIVAPGGAIGWPHAGSESIAYVDLEPGDALVMYTDGLIEAGKNILEGQEALERHARTLLGMPAQETASLLVRRALESGERRDDSLALVVRRTPALERTSWRYPRDPQSVPRARVDATTWLAARGVNAEDRYDVQLIAAELLSNASTAARREIALTLALDERTVTVEVSDDGRGRPDIESLGKGEPAPDIEAGRGLFIVRAIAEALTFFSTSEGTVARAVKELRRVSPAAVPHTQSVGEQN